MYWLVDIFRRVCCERVCNHKISLIHITPRHGATMYASREELFHAGIELATHYTPADYPVPAPTM